MLRPGTPDDAAAVAAVHEVARAAYYGGTAALPAAVDPDRLAMWQTLLGDPSRATVWCAEAGQGVVGFCSFGAPLHGVPGPVLELHALYVLPSAWGSGTGAGLHAVFVDELTAGPWLGGVLDVWSGNERAIAFYRRRGWVLDGRSRPGPTGTSYAGMALRPTANTRRKGSSVVPSGRAG